MANLATVLKCSPSYLMGRSDEVAVAAGTHRVKAASSASVEPSICGQGPQNCRRTADCRPYRGHSSRGQTGPEIIHHRIKQWQSHHALRGSALRSSRRSLRSTVFKAQHRRGWAQATRRSASRPVQAPAFWFEPPDEDERTDRAERYGRPTSATLLAPLCRDAAWCGSVQANSLMAEGTSSTPERSHCPTMQSGTDPCLCLTAIAGNPPMRRVLSLLRPF